MNDKVKKVAIAGVVGVTMMNSVPYNVMALGVEDGSKSSIIQKSMNEMILTLGKAKAKLSLEEGTSYFNEKNGKLFISSDAKLRFEIVEEGSVEEIAGECSEDSSLSFKTEDGYFEIGKDEYGKKWNYSLSFSDGSSYSFTNDVFMDFFNVGYTGLTEVSWLDEKTNVSLKLEGKSIDENDKPIVVDDWYKGGTLIYNLSLNSSIGLENSSLSVKLGNLDIPQTMYQVVDNGDGTGTLALNIPLNNPLLGLENAEGSFNLNITLEDNLGGSSSYKDTIKVDNKVPKIETDADFKYFKGLNGKVYIENNSLRFNFTASDKGNDKLTISFNGKSKDCSDGDKVSFDVSAEDLNVTDKVFKVEDTLGNSVDYTLLELLGLEGDGVVIGLPGSSAGMHISNFSSSGNGWYSGENVTLALEAHNDAGISKVEYINNGIKREFEVNSIDFNQEVKLPNGVSNVTLVVYDLAGDKLETSGVLKLDNDIPEIENIKLSLDKDSFNVYDGVAYVGDDFTIKGNAIDQGSGVKEIRVIKDGVVIKDSLPCKITEDGVYSVEVEDCVGNVKTYSLSEIVGKEFNSLVISKNAPELVIKDFVGDSVSVGGINWYKDLDNIDFNVKGSNLKTVSVVLDDTTTLLEEDAVVGDYSVPFKDLSQGSHKVVVTVTSKSGKKTVSEVSFGIDSTKPSIASGSLEGEYLVRDGSLWFSSIPTVKIEANDTLTGVKEYILTSTSGIESRNETGIFKLSDGEYTVKVVDMLGNVSEAVPLRDLLNLESGNIEVDTDNPISYIIKSGTTVDDFYNSDFTLKGKVSDEKGIYNAKVYINDSLVNEYIRDDKNTLIKDCEFLLDNKYTEFKEGNNIIRVEYEDYAGNKRVKEDSIKLDRVAPDFSNAIFSTTKEEKDYGVFFKEKPKVYLHSNDSGVGIEKYVLCDEEGNELKSDYKGEFTLSTGEYYFKVVDKLGNSSDVFKLKDIAGLSSNKIIVDDKAPVIDCSRPDGDVDGWYSEDKEYTVSLHDDIGIFSAEVSINGIKVDSFLASDSGVLDKTLKANTSKVSANEDGSYQVNVRVVDNAGNVSEWRDIVYIDRVAPSVDRFIIQAEGYKEGADSNGSDKYGFYISGASDVEVQVSDGNISSGMNKLHYTLTNSDGTFDKGVVNIQGGVGIVHLPENFKGFISAYATDMVGNIGESNKPDGIISESGNVHVNTAKVDINLPSTPYTDNSGNYLYSGDVSAEAVISDKVSGLRKVEWGVNDTTKGVVDISNDGVISGDTASIVAKDKNLVVDLEKTLEVTENANSLKVWVRVTDRVGHVSMNSKTISIDKDSPIIDVTYGETLSNGYYNRNRVATVTIKERNFKASDVHFNGTYGTVSEWSKVDNDTWSANIVFSEDKEYQWSVDYTDMAGNKGKGYSSEKFTIDKTTPVLSVNFDNNNVENGNFYKSDRTATVSIMEKNFNAGLVNLSGNGSIGNWSHGGDVHTAKIVFSNDGEYEFGITTSDMAGNTSDSFSSGKFVIDKTIPNLEVVGVQDGVSYKKNNGFTVRMSDTYIDTVRSHVTLSSRVNGDFKLTGSINDTTGEFSFEGVPEDIKYDDLYNLKAVIYDKAGNYQEKNINYSINRFGSQYKFLSDDVLNTVIGKAEDIYLEEVSVDRLDKDSIKIVVIRDGKEIMVDKNLVSIEETGGVTGPWVYKYTINKKVFNKDGKYQIQVYSKTYDGTDNVSLSQEYSFILDTTDPEVIVSGVNSDEVYNDVSRKVTIDVRDLSGVDKITAKLDGKEKELSLNEGIYSLVVDESNSRQSLSVKVVDKAGNSTSVEVKDFLITSNILVSVVNSPIFKGVSVAIGVVVVGLIALLFKRRKDNKEEELKLSKENAQMYKESTTGSSSASHSGSSDEVK